jgi:tripartite-type tricarboxylate transporter receptor subunit TctC
MLQWPPGGFMIRIALALLAACVPALAAAQSYPARPLTIINGFPPGGPTDAALRPIAAKLAGRLGQPVLVDNRPGAAGMLGAAAVAHAAPDGYVLLFGVAANLAVAPATMRRPPYDPVRAFTPVGEIARGPYLWLVRADNPARDMAQFVAWTKAHPGKVNYASPGQGSVHHIATEILKQKTGADMTHVPYKGGTALATALLGGEVQAMIESPSAYLANIRAGKLRALAVTGEHRLPALPDVATLDEQGIHGLDVHSWWGLAGPAGMPKEVVGRLNAELRAVLADPQLLELFAKMNVTPTPGTPEAFAAYIAEEAQRWKRFVAESGVNLAE